MADRDLLPLLQALPPDRLVDLVLDLVRGDRALERRVRLALPPSDAGVAALRAEVDEVLRTRRYLDYRAMIAYADEAQEVVALLQQAADGPAAAAVLPVVERALDHVVKLLLRGDDSAGAVGDVAVQLMDVHLRAAQRGPSDPVRLVRWLIRFTFDDQDFFHPDVRAYGPALGEAGLAAYREQVHRRLEAEPESFAAQHALQQLALLDRDVEAIVRLFGRGLEHGAAYQAVAEAFREIDEPDLALDWALRGCERAAGWQSRALFHLAAELLSERGEDVVDLRERGLRVLPDLESYLALRDAASAAGCWPERRPAALDLLRNRSVDEYLRALLADEDVEVAWTALQSPETGRVQDELALRVAFARAETEPGDAVPYVQAAVERTLRTADRTRLPGGGEAAGAAARARAQGRAARAVRGVPRPGGRGGQAAADVPGGAAQARAPALSCGRPRGLWTAGARLAVLAMLPAMTTPDNRLALVLDAYADDPMPAGDVVLLLDDAVCMEVGGLADHWDEQTRRSTAEVLRDTAQKVVLAIARPGADLLPQDRVLWRELSEELRDSPVQLAPLQALPAA